MHRARLALVIPVALLAALLAMPSGVLAADPVVVTGTVVRDGQPVTGVHVAISVTGGDTIIEATTDEAGAFSAEVDAGIGSEVTFAARGQQFSSGPDARGCVHTEMPAGRLTTTLETIPPAPVQVVMDQVVTSTVCSLRTERPNITPPATDALVAPRRGSAPGGLLVVLGVLALAATGSLLLAGRRR
jgi:hypothetical protein